MADVPTRRDLPWFDNAPLSEFETQECFPYEDGSKLHGLSRDFDPRKAPSRHRRHPERRRAQVRRRAAQDAQGRSRPSWPGNLRRRTHRHDGSSARLFEIRSWLRYRANIESFVILDDGDFWSFGWMTPFFVWMQAETGELDRGDALKLVCSLEDPRAERVIETLNAAGSPSLQQKRFDQCNPVPRRRLVVNGRPSA